MRNRVLLMAAAALSVPTAARAQDIPQLPGFPDVVCNAPDIRGDAVGSGAFALALAMFQGQTVCVDLSGFISQEGKLSFLNVAGISLGGLGTVDLTGTFNPDPFITFGATTTNLVAGPVTYAFLFGTPIVPGFYTSATSTTGVSVTNGASGTSSATTSPVYPTFVSAYGTVGLAPTNLGVDLGTTTCTAGPGIPFTVTQTCGYGTATNTFAPTFYDNLEALLTYNQTDLASVASWSGAVTLNAATVPEPTTVTLMVTGVLVIAGVARNRRRTV
jgi:hypothetical protein